MKKTPKVALVTGGGRRIGASIVKTVHHAGFNVVLHHYQSAEEAMKIAQELNAERPNSVACVRADLSDMSQLADLIQQATKAFGQLDALVNNASVFYKTDMGSVSESQWDDMLTTNLKGPFFLTQAAIPYLKKTQGCIINIADIHADQPLREYSTYCISKAGLVMMTRVLAKELAPIVRVNTVSPGAIDWPEGENTLPDSVKNKIIESTALKRHGEPNDIANAVLFLIERAPYTTGQVITVDGGRSLF